MARKPKHKLLDLEPSLKINQEIAISIKWNDLISHLSEVVVQGFATYFGVTDGISSGISSLASAASQVKVERPSGERAWSLFCLSFAWAFDELLESSDGDRKAAVSAVRTALKLASSGLEKGDERVPISFLDAPTTLPLYSKVRDEIIKRKANFRPGGGEEDEVLRARFDAAFNRGVFEVWSSSPELYAPIEASLRAPGGAASAFDVQWKSYRKSLIYDFDVRPVFGQEKQKISISQLYVPLRAGWMQQSQSRGRAGQRPVEDPKCEWHCVELEAELESWIKDHSSTENLVLIGGGPGSGKSTTVRALARRLAERDNIRPLFIPLQHIEIERDLRDAVNSFFTDRTRSPFRQPPLSREAIENGPPILLIFDGLDELARPGEAANEITRLFMTKLSQLLASLKGDTGVSFRAIITGRLPSFQAARLYGNASARRSYEVFGYNISESTKRVLKQGKDDLAKIDQRPLWWEKYSRSLGLSSALPNAMNDQTLEGITSEPLLC